MRIYTWLVIWGSGRTRKGRTQHSVLAICLLLRHLFPNRPSVGSAEVRQRVRASGVAPSRVGMPACKSCLCRGQAASSARAPQPSCAPPSSAKRRYQCHRPTALKGNPVRIMPWHAEYTLDESSWLLSTSYARVCTYCQIS